MVSKHRKMAGERVKERIARLETLLGEWLEKKETVATKSRLDQE